ncbi:ribonuclease III [Anaerobium acetethylicum]|uniref:Ribonuclease 3 n=1 Tax=Anaerobium acetethylicum TaxID=1619234 RepID=A0A1D3TPP6_9FIRM|nr:ribonuclease III [Anaerobium acetethylicum]SCP95456.1 ribonuclease-3 [Anaerobium acetethylicum]
MNEKQKIDELESRIGYAFHDRMLITQALTHSSYSNENRIKRVGNNERLEFLGDAVLELATSDFLYKKYPEKAEGYLTKLRASIVCEQTLSLSTRDIDLGKYLLLGKGEDLTGGRERKSILSDALEAVIGAIYLDGGFTNAKEFIDRFILTDIEDKQLFYDSKTILQEIVQAAYDQELSYSLIGEEGPDHNKRFVVNVLIGDDIVGQGTGTTKKGAEQEAAFNAIRKLKGSGNAKK